MRVKNLLKMRRQSKPSAFVEGDNQDTRVDRVHRGGYEKL
jgi:hypothetical protein